MNRIELINLLLTKFQDKNYLEIGINTGKTFSQINALFKVGVDPIPASKLVKSLLNDNTLYFSKTSDLFFMKDAPILYNNKILNVVLIDGLHEWKQVIKDVDNTLKYTNTDSYIILHDCNPSSEERQLVPRQSKGWNGDVWKAIVHLRTRLDIDVCVLNADQGLGIIKKRQYNNTSPELIFSDNEFENLTYKDLEKDRKDLLNLKEVKEYFK